MNQINTALGDPYFFYGAAVAGAMMTFLMFYAAYMRIQTLYLTAKNKGREKIGDKFYYLVEENEYNQLQLVNLPKFGKDKVSETAIPFVLYTTKVSRATVDYFCGTEHNCYSTDIRRAKFYWSEQAALKELGAFRLLYLLDLPQTVTAVSIDKLKTDAVGYNAILAIARQQRKDQQVWDPKGSDAADYMLRFTTHTPGGELYLKKETAGYTLTDFKDLSALHVTADYEAILNLMTEFCVVTRADAQGAEKNSPAAIKEALLVGGALIVDSAEITTGVYIELCSIHWGENHSIVSGPTVLVRYNLQFKASQGSQDGHA